MKRITATVTGKVQGVFYRASTEKTARRIGLTGFVRNEADGSVYLEAQGTEAQLQEFIEWCKTGPERAVVASVNVSEIPLQEETGFRVRR
jgi:acylphosphatase